MKEAGKRAFHIFGVIFIIMTLGYMLLTFVYLIPNDWMEENVKKSAKELLDQGVYPTLYMKGGLLDNWTDAECISVTFNISSSNPFYNAMNAYHMGETDGVQRLYDTVFETDASLKVVDHSYLWHGFRIWLRPLLCLWELADIRYLCFVTNLILFGVVAFFLYKYQGGLWSLLPFFVAFIYFDFTLESISLLFFNDINVMLLSCLGVMWAARRKMDLAIVFSIIGSMIAFSSMLILPMLTMAFPLLIWLIVTEREKMSVVGRCLHVVKYAICWFVGYAGTMFSKIFISQLLVKSGEGLLRVQGYSGSTQHLSLAERLDILRKTYDRARHFSEVRHDMLLVLIMLLLCYMVVSRRISKKKLLGIAPYLIVAFIPVVWVVAMAGHAHHFWTYFNFSIMIFAVLQLLCNICHVEKKNYE